MDAGEFLGAFFGLFLLIGSIALSGFFIYWQVKFLIVVSKHLPRITAALEKIANKK